MACQSKNSMIIFGGEKNEESRTSSECLNDVYQLSLDTNEWKRLRCSGESVEPRRDHAGCLVGRDLVIHGGVNRYDKYLSDLLVLNLDSLNWSIVEVEEGLEEFKEGIAGHCLSLVTSFDKKFSSLYSDPIDKKINGLPLLKSKNQQGFQDGIYVFGGKTSSSEESNEVHLIRVGRKPVKIEKLKTLGERPPPRWGHTMNFIPEMSSLVVVGGRQDCLFEKHGKSCLNDVWVLDLETLGWSKAKIGSGEDSVWSSRYFHAATIGDHPLELVVFGGLSEGKYVGGSVDVLELNQREARKLEKEMKFKEALKQISGKNKQNGKKDDGEFNAGTFLTLRRQFEAQPKQETKVAKTSQERSPIEGERILISLRPVPKAPDLDDEDEVQGKKEANVSEGNKGKSGQKKFIRLSRIGHLPHLKKNA